MDGKNTHFWQKICIIAADLQTTMRKTQLLTWVLAAIIAVSCTKPASYGDMSIGINYSVNGKPLITDSLCYHNEAGNAFMITEIQWFVSKMELQDERGEWIPMGTFYIDTDIAESQTLRMSNIPVGHYKALRFTFGLDEEDNQSGRYSDPPESNMFWPEPLGGGYHYMKLNGKYVNGEGELVPLNVHLGIGQNEDKTIFYQNYFTVEDPIDLEITENKEQLVQLNMIVDNWFRHPNLYDFNVYGSAIMQNQDAQQALKENGQDVFTWTVIEEPNEKDMKREEIVEDFNRIMQKATPKPHFWTWQNVKERASSCRVKL